MTPDRGLASTLTGVFAPGAPALFEALRTLVVMPRRTVTPGETIRVEFSFSNLGGAPATGVRVRFALPTGVTHVAGSDTLDDAPLDGESLVATEGAALGDLPSNTQRRVACSFRVNSPIEDGSELVFQAVLATEQTPLVASNAERLRVRSEPNLQSTSTYVTIAAPNEPKPGDVLTVRATVANTGESSAHDVMAILPVPEHTAYVPRSARIAGRSIPGVESDPFDYANETIVAQRLAAGQSVLVEYQVTVEAPLTDGTRIKVSGVVAAREVPEFPLQSSDVVINSPVNFENDETALVLHCDEVVSPGVHVPVTLRLVNAGTGAASGVAVAFDLPPGLIYSPGSAQLDGQPISDESFAGNALTLGTVASGRVVDVAFSAIVGLPTAGEMLLPISATLRWRGGERRFGRQLRLRASARFTRARNYIEVDRTVVQAREEVQFVAHIFNDGTAPEPAAHLRILPGAFLEDVRVAQSNAEPESYREAVPLGVVEPHDERTVAITARVVSPVPDRSQLTLGAVLELGSTAFDLGVASVVARSRPQIPSDRCNWEIVQSEPLRPNQTHDIVIRFTNDGSDALREARMQLTLPPELTIDRTENARREGTTLHFGDVAAQTTHEARIGARLLRPPRRDDVLQIEGVLYGRGISPLEFAPLELRTFAEPEFADGAELRSNPNENVNAGERVTYHLRLQNSGDGPAERLVIRTVPSNLAVYVPSTTTLNGLTIPDDLGTSQLWSQRGLMLTDVNPAVELHVRWEMVLVSPLAGGTAVDARAVVEWDGDRSVALTAPTLHVVSAPSLEATSSGTPISVAQILPQAEVPRPERVVLEQRPPVEMPPPPRPARPAALEEPRPQPKVPVVSAEPPPPVPEPAAIEEPVFASAAGAVAYVDFSNEQLAQAIRTLEKSDAGGLIQHVFALRVLFPDSVMGTNPQLSQLMHNASRAIRAPLDRFFVRLRVPRLSVTAKDLEDRDSRLALRLLVKELIDSSPGTQAARETGIVRLRGPVDVEALRFLAPQLETAPLGSVVPWIVSAHILGSVVEYNGESRSNALGEYRSELLKVFTLLETLPMPEFHRVLTSSVNRGLDDALVAVLDALRTAAHVAVQ